MLLELLMLCSFATDIWMISLSRCLKCSEHVGGKLVPTRLPWSPSLSYRLSSIWSFLTEVQLSICVSVVDGLNKILLFYSCLPVIAAGFWKVWLLGGWKRSPTIRTCTLITKWCTFIVGCVLPLHCCMILHYIALSTTWWRSCFYSKFINWIMWVIGDTMLE